MKNFYYQLLQQLNAKKSEKGFTLIELLVVIIIIGILSAIALPAFLNQANKARQSEAKQALGAINRGQQAYYLEKQLFSTNIFGLGLGLQLATENYSYGNAPISANMTSNRALDVVGAGKTFGGGINGTTPAAAVGCGVGGGLSDVDCLDERQGFDGYSSFAVAWAAADNQDAVRDYMGVALLLPGDAANESTTVAVLCEEENLDGETTVAVNISNDAYPVGTSRIIATTVFDEMTDAGAAGEVSCRGTITTPDGNAVVAQNGQNVGQ